MNLKDLELLVVEAFCTLDTNPLNMLDQDASYSHNYKDEFIEEMEEVFNKIKSEGIYKLSVNPSRCKFCYPDANAYSFHHPNTGEFFMRYVIHQSGENEFGIEQCRNKPLPELEHGMPF